MSYDLDVLLQLEEEEGPPPEVSWDLDVGLMSVPPGALTSGSGFDLFVLDRSLKRIGIITEYNSLVWISRMWDHSEATLKCSPDSIPAGAVFLERSDTDEAMLITRVHQVLSNTERYLEIGCKGATIMLARRVNWWTHTFKDTNLALAVQTLVTDAQATYESVDRTIANMNTDIADLTGTGTTVTKQVSWGNVAEAVYEMCRAAGYSFGVRYIAGVLEAFVRAGEDLSASVLFSTEYADLASADLDSDVASAANLAVVGGQGDGAQRTVTITSVPDGLELSELWVDAKDVSDDNLTSPQYLTALQQRGAEKIADLPVTLSLEVMVGESRYRYRDDYFLGDTVSYRALGFEGTDIISEVTETVEQGERRIELALGVTAPTIRKLIR